MPFFGCCRCVDEGIPEEDTSGEVRYSFGCYASRYCNKHWRESGYRDATDDTAEFSEMDAGERIEEDY